MSALYQQAQQLLATGQLNWAAGAWDIMLVGGGYTPNFITDTTLAVVPGAAQLTGVVALSGLSVANGICKAANPIWANLLTTAKVTAALIMAHNATLESSALIAYIDSGIGFGISPNHEDTTLVWDANFGGIFAP